MNKNILVISVLLSSVIAQDTPFMQTEKVELCGAQEKESILEIIKQGTQAFCNTIVKNNDFSKEISEKLRSLSVQGVKSAFSMWWKPEIGNTIKHYVKIAARSEKENLKLAISAEEFLETELGEKWLDAYQKCENYKMEDECSNAMMVELAKFAVPAMIVAPTEASVEKQAEDQKCLLESASLNPNK